jgi:hypothetical protein
MATTDQPTEAEAARQTAQAKIDTIRNTASLSPDGKRSAIARTYLQMKTKLDALQSTAVDTRTKREDELKRKLFGIPNTADGTASLSYRDAQDRAAQLTDEPTANSMLTRAQNAGDDLLVRAVIGQAFASQWSTVINAYETLYPANEAAADELWNLTATRGLNATGLLGYLEYHAPLPAELLGMDEYTIAQTAAQPKVSTEL